MIRVLLLIFGCLCVAASAVAQTPLPTDYTFTAHFATTPDGAPISSFDFLKSAALCDQAPTPPPSGVQVNPRFIRWTDPANASRDCVLDTGATSGVLFAMPFGGQYIGKMTAKVIVGGVPVSASASDPSNPFVRGTPPAVAVGVRVGG